MSGKLIGIDILDFLNGCIFGAAIGSSSIKRLSCYHACSTRSNSGAS